MKEMDEFLTDLSGNGNDGIIVGPEWTNDSPDFGNSDAGLAFYFLCSK